MQGMNVDEIIAKVKSLSFPAGAFVVFGSAPMALAGLREAQDIDLLVSESLFQQCKEHGWKELYKSEKDRPLVKDDFEAHHDWDFSSYHPTLEQLLTRAVIIDGVPFASLQDVRSWKEASGRPKDLADIELIDQMKPDVNTSV